MILFQIADGHKLPDKFMEEVSLFKQFLQSFGGGEKTTAVSNQIVAHVVAILKHFGQYFSANTIIQNLERVEANFITPSISTLQASTIKNYLLDFDRFVTWGRHKQRGWIDACSADMITYQLHNWMKSLNKRIAVRSHQTKIAHGARAIGVNDVQLYLSSERCNAGIRLLDNDQVLPLAMEDHTRARNYLIMIVILSNATRAGPIVSLCVQDVEVAKTNIHDGRHVIKVNRHKTAASYGPAQLCLGAEQFRHLVTYIEQIRPHIAMAAEQDQVFISWTGRPLDQSQVANIVTVELTMAVGGDVRSSCTLMRKSIVSLVLQMDLGVRNEQDLATLMKHSERMQKSTYNVSVTDNNMARMSRLVFNVITGKRVKEQDLCRPSYQEPGQDDSDNDEQISTDNEGQADDHMSVVDEENVDDGKDSVDEENVADDSMDPADEENSDDGMAPVDEDSSDDEIIITKKAQPVAVCDQISEGGEENDGPVGKRKRYPHAFREETQRLFSKHVQNRSIKTNDVRKMLVSHPKYAAKAKECIGSGKESFIVKRIYDLVRSLFRYK